MPNPKSHATGRLQGVVALSRALENELLTILREEKMCDKADDLIRQAHLKITNITIDYLATAHAWQLTADRERSKGNG